MSNAGCQFPLLRPNIRCDIRHPASASGILHPPSPEPPMLNPNRYFSPVPAVREIARGLYDREADLPLVCPHGHVDPRMLAEDAPFPNPAALIVVPDHYLVRMLYSQGVAM